MQITRLSAANFPHFMGIAVEDPGLKRGETNRVEVPPHFRRLDTANCDERIMQEFIMTDGHLNACIVEIVETLLQTTHMHWLFDS